MAGVAIESRVEGVWFAKQTAKGSPASTAIKRGFKVGGDLNVNPEHGSENRSTNERFTDSQDFVNTITGNGNPALQGQPGVAAYLLYLMLGQEAVSGSGDPYEHVITPANAGSFWFTAWKRVGETVGPLRQKFNDCRHQSLRVEMSQAAKVARIIPTFLSLDAGETFATDPVKDFDVDDAWVYTEGEGGFVINGEAWGGGQSSLAFTINDNLTPWFGEGVTPHALVYGIGAVNIEGLTVLVDEKGYEFYCEQVYGMASPPAGTKPLTTIPPLGSYEMNLRRGNIYGFTAPGSGTYTLTVDGQATTAIAFGANAAAIEAALVALNNINPGDVTVTGSGPFVITFATKIPDTFVASAGTLVDNGARRQFKVEFPNLKWTPDLAISGNPDGGAVELPLAAETRKDRSGSDPQIRITSRVADAAYA